MTANSLESLKAFLASPANFPLTLTLREELGRIEQVPPELVALLVARLRSPDYLAAIKEGETRRNLDGTLGVGAVSASDEKSAQKKLNGILVLRAVRSNTGGTYQIQNFQDYLEWDSRGLKSVELLLDTEKGRIHGHCGPKRLRAAQALFKKAISQNKSAVVYIRVSDFHRPGFNSPIMCLVSKKKPNESDYGG